MSWIKKVSLLFSIIIISSILIHATSRMGEIIEDKEAKPYSWSKDINFAGEEVPLTISDVKERLDREMLVNCNWHSNTYLVLKRSNKVFPVIEPIMKKYGIPDDFKYLAVVESNLLNIVSPAGARGIWQFMPNTAKERGLEVNDEIDERYHLEKATEEACKYLLAAKDKFGSWTLAAASYNGGISGISRQLDNQKVTNYYDLLLTEETARYVFRIIAIKEIMKNPTVYGYTIDKNDLYEYIPTKKIEITTSIPSWADFALEQGINYKILKIHNPWLRDTKLTNLKNKSYFVEIPLRGY